MRLAQAVLMLNAGTAIEAIIALTNYSRRQIFDLRNNYLKKGIIVIKDKKKGKPKELLTKKQSAEIVKIIKEETPRDYSCDTDFWTTGIVGAIIESEYKVKYRSKTSIYLIFKQAKFTYHKPGRLYQARNEQERQLRIIYPTQKLFLIWDKAPWHKGSKAQQFIKEDGNIKTLDFPRAVPEENPQEHVWKNGRSNITHNRFIDDIDQAADEFVNYLNKAVFNYSFLGI